MKLLNSRPLAFVSVTVLLPFGAFAQTTQDIRIVTYNTQGDVSPPTPTGVLPYLATVLEGIGQQKYVGDSILQLPDIIALQETTSNTTTVVPLANDLNTYYGSNIFATSTYQATTSDGVTDGGGPNGLIYNQNRINLIASVGVGTPEGGTPGAGFGEFRQVVRYEFQPIADKGTTNGVFYVYDSHYKSGDASTTDDGTTDGALRNGEAQIVRNDEATNLPANAAVLYVGDFNTGNTGEAMYETLTAVNAPSGNAGQGQGIDPLNPVVPPNTLPSYTIDMDENSSYKGYLTESDTDLRYRDDYQMMTSNVYSDAAGTLDYISGSYHAFGNNGNTAVFGTINSTSNTALNDIIGNGSLTPSTVFAAMNASLGSDHLPVVADYSLALPAQNLTWDNAGTTLINDGVTWDINHFLNWNSGSNSSTYTDGSTVTFNDTNNHNYAVTLNSTVSPGSVTINNSGVSGNYTLSGTGTIAGSGSLTKIGTGTATISTPNTYTGGTNANGGTLVIAPTTVANTVALPDGSVSIGAAGTLQLADNASASTPSNSVTDISNQLMQMSSLSITAGGVLDIRNNHFYVADPGGTPHDSTYTSILGWIKDGANSTPGGVITSSEGLSGYGVGIVDGNDGVLGANVSANQIEVAYTLDGDANLDGKVDITDFNIFAPEFGLPTTLGWEAGDFNYSGAVDIADFNLFAGNFGLSDNGTAVSMPAADYAALDAFAAANGLSLTSVPEPASLGLLTLGLVGMLSRRRRKVSE